MDIRRSLNRAPIAITGLRHGQIKVDSCRASPHHHSAYSLTMLPPLPSFLPSRPADVQEPDLTVYPDILTSTPGASSSRLGPNHPANSKCSICSQEPKYTCPRCSARTCSLPCSKAHKSNTGCDGTRDPAKFVTLTEFGQGDWGGDYAYLESGRRKIADWGKDLPATPSHASHGTRGGRGGHERGQGGKKRGPPKLEGLRRELEARGVEVEFMPEGMGRRKLNQSTWNPKYVQALVMPNLRPYSWSVVWS